MTVGKDVSMLFTDVVNCMQTENLELKKLVYLYLINYAKSQPDLAILAVNTFVKDSQDPNPLIRALAVRTMGCIRVDRITEYLCDPLQRCLKDDDPYVRKTAAICVAKLHDINAELVEDRGFLDILRDMISDSNPMVVANAVAALSEIQEGSSKPVFDITPNTVFKLLAALNECTEWGQVFILDSLSKYKARDAREAEGIVERVTPRLQHANSAVVLSAVKVILKAVRAIGRCAIKLEKAAERCINVLLDLIKIKKPPSAFVSRLRSAVPASATEPSEEYEESSAPVSGGAPPSAAPPAAPAPSPAPAAPAPAAASAPPDLLGDLMGLDAAIVPVPEAPSGPSLPVLLAASAGQGLQINGQLERKDGQVVYRVKLDNNSSTSLDGFMMQLNKNSFGISAPAGVLPVPPLQPGASATADLPLTLFQNASPPPPSSVLQVAVKNNQQPVWYFTDKIRVQAFFTEEGRMERGVFLETWKALPDSNEVSRDLGITIGNIDSVSEKLASNNVFFVAKRHIKDTNQHILYLSAKLAPSIPILLEITFLLGVAGTKCAIKTPSPEWAPLVFEAVENILQ
ncbi:unnamed protein product [Closterium sp. Naga37s-1]|nr:unnamed protein product [Closterium sp. Naga37s-1]